MAKPYRKSIRIGNSLHQERFDSRAQAERWYKEMKEKKKYLRHGLSAKFEEAPTFQDYAAAWLKARMKDYPMATWDSDERRLRLHLLPVFGELPVNAIHGPMIKKALLAAKNDRTGGPISKETRKRLLSLLSSIFTSALNEAPPLVNFNPAANLIFESGRRAKVKRPIFMDDPDDCLKFIQGAKQLGNLPYVAACLFLMAGPRKSESNALKWENVNFRSRSILFSHIVEQASMTLKKRTKSGEDAFREVFMSNELYHVLKWWHGTTEFSESDDFVLCIEKGKFIAPWTINTWFKTLYSLVGKRMSPHRLRHTYGSQFAANSGNMRALQKILGHSSLSTTEIYAELSGKQIKPFSETVKYGIKH